MSTIVVTLKTESVSVAVGATEAPPTDDGETESSCLDRRSTEGAHVPPLDDGIRGATGEQCLLRQREKRSDVMEEVGLE